MHRHHNTVPTTRDVIPGASVNIVLKQDQPTGRTVTGTVRDVLTRGNHPRGIKVRLSDGRVGRVQSIDSDGAKAAASEDLRPTAIQPVHGTAEDGGRLHDSRTRHDRRRTEDDGVPPHQVGLDAFIKPAKQRGKGKGRDSRGSGQNGSVVGGESPFGAAGSVDLEAGQSLRGAVTCPVCGEFDGDEMVVAHHVASHFDA